MPTSLVIRLSLLSLLLTLSTISATAQETESTWLRWFSRDLRTLETQIQSTRDALTQLGVPVMAQTTAELGYQHQQLQTPPPTSPWIQIDLGTSQPIDWVVLVPALVDWQPGEQKTYGFPRRFRIDISDDPAFTTFTPLAVFTEEDFRSPGLAPAVFRARGLRGQFIRLTVTKLAEENGTHFFALSELMIVQGIKNIALNKTTTATASNSTTLPPRWNLKNLIDGRSPLGPPIERHLLPYDGLFADQTSPAEPAWIAIDLGKSQPIDEVRLHPVHARLGADVPGFAFPLRFRVELSDAPDFTNPTVLLDATNEDFPNPGNNPVTTPVNQLSGRHLRVLMIQDAPGRRNSFGLSEIEIFSNHQNLAPAATVTSSPDRSDRPEKRPPSLIVDGHTSYGHLLPLPQWLERWQSRRQLQDQLSDLQSQHTEIEDRARRRAWTLAASLALILPIAGITFAIFERRSRTRALLNLRNRLAQDLHDEIGSNIAGIAMISETAATQPDSPSAQKEDLQEINRIAQETTEAMREVLWLVGARAESGPDLITLLKRTANRLLTGLTVNWTQLPDQVPTTWPAESRRQVFLLFKEALTNIARHAQAKHVTLSLEFDEQNLILIITDDGRGFDPQQKSNGMGLTSMKQRAKTLHARMTITSDLNTPGTQIHLTAPIQ